MQIYKPSNLKNIESPKLFDFRSQKIKHKALYTADDIAHLPHLTSMPGEAPFIRGPYKSMYTEKPWTIRQYAGFGNAEDTNILFKQALQQGSQGLSVAFDLPTHRGLDSDNPIAMADVGMAGVAIDSVEDMKRLFSDIPLDKISVSMTMNGAVLPILAAYIVAAEEAGYSKKTLTGTIQNDILKEFMVRNTYIFSPQPSLRITTDVVEYATKHLPRFNAMSISGYHFQEAGADAALELALTLANCKTYIENVLKRGLDVNQFCSQLSFFFGVGSDFYIEIAKLRAARVLWSEITESIGATTEKARALRMHCQTSGWSLASKEPSNNIVRTTLQAMAAAFGGTQSLHTNAYDEALSLPTPESSRLARNTQLIMQHETGICNTIDPWAGSYMMESLTDEVITKVRLLMQEIENHGGMIEAFECGWVKQRIQEKAAQVQAEIDSGERKIVGHNFNAQETHKIDISHKETQQSANNDKMLSHQLSNLEKLKSSRNQLEVKRALKKLTDMAMNDSGNLLEATINAIRARATIGECCDALEKVWPRYTSKPVAIVGNYSLNLEGNDNWKNACFEVEIIKNKLSRKPKILIAKIGQDGHDRGANLLASSLTEAGFEVHLAPLFISPLQISDLAIALQVDIVGISSLAGTHLKLLPELIDILSECSSDVHVVIGGIIPESDFSSLYKNGVAAIFSHSESISKIIMGLTSLFKKQNS
jgi:methylmalonyl-CoA mutase